MGVIYESLSKIVGKDYVSNRQEELYFYGRDASIMPPNEPDYVVMPKTAKEVKKMWSTFTEFQLELKTFDDLVSFCFVYFPSSIDIIEPETINQDSRELALFLSDVMGKLHQYDMGMKKLILENRSLQKKLNLDKS